MGHPTGFRITPGESRVTNFQAQEIDAWLQSSLRIIAPRHYTSVNPLSHQGDASVALVLRPKLHREALVVAADPEAARDKL
ncbi:MAG: hypothetical protein ACR2NM_02605 [Bythopirellula sp.]